VDGVSAREGAAMLAVGKCTGRRDFPCRPADERDIKAPRPHLRKFYLRPVRAATIFCAALLPACTSVPVAQCPPLKQYPPEFSQRLATELEAMPADSATVEAIGDYIALRDSVRACTGDKP
jgi:hypothetical protein